MQNLKTLVKILEGRVRTDCIIEEGTYNDYVIFDSDNIYEVHITETSLNNLAYELLFYDNFDDIVYTLEYDDFLEVCKVDDYYYLIKKD